MEAVLRFSCDSTSCENQITERKIDIESDIHLSGSRK